MTELEEAHCDRSYGLGILNGLKFAEANRWEDARVLAEKLIADGRKVLIATRARAE